MAEPTPEKQQLSFRMDRKIAKRLNLVSQVTGHSKNTLIVNAILESIVGYETDGEFQAARKNWLATVMTADD